MAKRCWRCEKFISEKGPEFPYCSRRCRDYNDGLAALGEVLQIDRNDDDRMRDDGHADPKVRRRLS